MTSPRTCDCKWSQADLNLSLASHCPNVMVSLKGTPKRLSWHLFLTIPMVGAGCAFLESVPSVPLGLISTGCSIQLLSKALRNSLEPLTDTWGLNVLKELGNLWSHGRHGTCTGTRGEINPGCVFLWLPAPLSTACHWQSGDIGQWVGARSDTGSWKCGW